LHKIFDLKDFSLLCQTGSVVPIDLHHGRQLVRLSLNCLKQVLPKRNRNQPNSNTYTSNGLRISFCFNIVLETLQKGSVCTPRPLKIVAYPPPPKGGD